MTTRTGTGLPSGLMFYGLMLLLIFVVVLSWRCGHARDREEPALTWACENGAGGLYSGGIVQLAACSSYSLLSFSLSLLLISFIFSSFGHSQSSNPSLVSHAQQHACSSRPMGHIACAEALIARGADLNAVDRYHNTALHWAIRRGHVKVPLFLAGES